MRPYPVEESLPLRALELLGRLEHRFAAASIALLHLEEAFEEQREGSMALKYPAGKDSRKLRAAALLGRL